MTDCDKTCTCSGCGSTCTTTSDAYREGYRAGKAAAESCDCKDGTRTMQQPGRDGQQRIIATVCTVCIAGKNLYCRGLERELAELLRRIDTVTAERDELHAKLTGEYELKPGPDKPRKP